MYPVTNKYKTAIRGSGLSTRVTGICCGTPFTDDNILKGSFSITGQCSSANQVEIGQVFVSELNITLRGLNIDRYTYKGQWIYPFFHITTETGEEVIPLGQYVISEAKKSAGGMVIKAYDKMSCFDKTCMLTSTTGLPIQMAIMACQACGLTLATTQMEFESFANGREYLTLFTEQNDIETWRDFISWLAQTCACNVFANREGEIEFRPYSQTPVDTLDTYHRFIGAEFSDFETFYTGVYLQSIQDQKTEYYNLDPDNGLTYNLGKNPFFQYGLEATRKAYCLDILSHMQNIHYVPFKIETVDDPSYDLMDVVLMPGGIGDSSKLFCITKFTWTYHDRLVLEGTGSDPALATAKSKVEKELSGILASTSDDTINFYQFKNAIDWWIRDGQIGTIARIDFVTKKTAHVDFRAEIKFEVDTIETVDNDGTYHVGDTAVTVQYILNEQVVEYHPLGTFTDGVFLEHLMYWWYSSKDVIGTLLVEMIPHGGDIRIKIGDVNALLYGESLVGEKDDLSPKFRDNLPLLVFDLFHEFDDEAAAVLLEPFHRGGVDSLPGLTFDGMIAQFTEGGHICAGIGFAPFLTDTLQYIQNGSVQTDGNIWKATGYNQYIQTANLYGVTGFLAHTGGMLSYQLSVDDGVTWGSWDGSAITPGGEMTYTAIHAIQSWPEKVMVKIIFDYGETLGGFILEGGRTSP